MCRRITSSDLIIEDATKSTNSTNSSVYAEKFIYGIRKVDEKSKTERLGEVRSDKVDEKEQNQSCFDVIIFFQKENDPSLKDFS